jgi:ferritin
MALISESLIDSLQNQMSHEMKNAHIYLFLSGYLNSKGMDKIAKFFAHQYDEELSHFRAIFDFLVDLDVSPNIIDVQDTNVFTLGLSDTITSVAQKFMEREVLTTQNLAEILSLSIDEENVLAEVFLRDMISKQRSEYAEATEFADKANICGDNWMNVLIWNNNFG